MKPQPYGTFKILKYLIKGLRGGSGSLFSEIISDYKKDQICRSNGHSGIVWIAGLPKSGTTMVEQIMDCTSYVQANKSLFRLVDNRRLDHYHGITDGMFEYLPKDRRSFLKTHTHFDDNYIQIARSYDAKIVIVMRDLCRMLISRYFHVLNDPAHWQHEFIVNLPQQEGLLLSLTEKGKRGVVPIDYYSEWIVGWKKACENEKNILQIQYEDYCLDPLGFISELLDFVNEKKINANDVEDYLKKIRSNASKITNFKKRYKIGSRSASTFRPRQDKQDDFDDEFLKYLKKHISELIGNENFFVFHESQAPR